MPDLSSDFSIANPFGLQASDFGYDIDAYGVALRFLSDLAGGTPEAQALEQNGGNLALLRMWEGSNRFRRVLAKCRTAGEDARRYLRERETPAAAPEGDGTTEPPPQRFIPLEDMPVRRSILSQGPSPASWGEG